ncbi:MAG TPA: OmpA family protein [Candidatus Kapabacteria bacterium]|nr:OmpA family protein [Candidatus Kapabacteria bacterium]
MTSTHNLRLCAALAASFLLHASCFLLSAEAQSNFVKLPLSINTPDQSELLPVISADGKTLYFTRTRIGMDSTVVFDIWLSHITNDSVDPSRPRDGRSIFSKPEFVGNNLASSYGIAVTSISPDNNTLYLIGKLESDAPPDERLFVSHKLLGGWSIPEPIKIPNLHPRGIYTDYSFGPDQRTLVMALNRDSSLGDRDLYVSFYQGSWSTPLWLGPDINSRYAEMTPYLSSDNKTLYFSSDRPGGIGAVDVYRSIRLDDSWQHWSKPENLGVGVNRLGRTTFYTEDAEGKYGYVSWRLTESDQSDIYRVKVSREQAVALVRGIVRDAAGKPLAAEIHYERLAASTEDTSANESGSGSGRSDPVTGEYEITLPAGARYALRAERDGYFPTSDNIDLTGLKSYEEIHRDLKLNKIQSGAAITLHNVFFETDKAELLPASFEELDRVKQLLTDHPEFKLQIAGFTDSTGTEAHNDLLSKDRAKSVVNYLTEHGIDATRLSAIGYGSQKPVATNTTEEGRAKNRRVEFILVSK